MRYEEAIEQCKEIIRNKYFNEIGEQAMYRRDIAYGIYKIYPEKSLFQIDFDLKDKINLKK